MGRRLSEDELQQALDFCGKLLVPTSPEDYRAAESLLAESFKNRVTDNPGPDIANMRLLDPQAPAIDPRIIETVVRERLPLVQRPASDIGDTAVDFQPNAGNSTGDAGCEESNVKAVFEKLNARKACPIEGVHNFEDEPLGQLGTGGGWVARLEKGKLGLVMLEG